MNFRQAPAGLDYDGAKWTHIGGVSSTGTFTATVTLSTGGNWTGEIPADAILFKPVSLEQAKTAYQWDHQNRLTSVTNESATMAANGTVSFTPAGTTTYAYDVIGRRAAVTFDAPADQNRRFDSTRISVYDGNQVVWAEQAADRDRSDWNTEALLWAPGTDQLLVMQERVNDIVPERLPVWTLTDHQGTVKDYLGKGPFTGVRSGLLLTRQYTPFGMPAQARQWSHDPWSGPTGMFSDVLGTSGFFYVGQEYDATTGLQYSRARYYDPVSSEFISQDPLGFAGGDTNLYRRAGNSPANATDPSGMIVETGWDAFSLGVGLVSLGYNLRYGTWKDVGHDVLGIVADVGATLLPGGSWRGRGRHSRHASWSAGSGRRGR